MDKNLLLLVVELLDKTVLYNDPMTEEEREVLAAIPAIIAQLVKLGQELAVKENFNMAEEPEEKVFLPWREHGRLNRLRRVRTMFKNHNGSLTERLKRANGNPTAKSK